MDTSIQMMNSDLSVDNKCLANSEESNTSTTQGDDCSQCCHTPWEVVIASFCGCFIIGGISYTSSIFFVEWRDTFEESSAKTSIISSLNVGVLCLIGPLASVVVNRVGFRRLIIGSGLLSTAGLISSAYTYNIYILMLTFGIVTGGGFGLAFTPIAVLPAIYFPKNQALVSGLGISGLGCGASVMPFIIGYLVEQYAWRGCMLIAGGMALNLCVCGALIKAGQVESDPTKVPKTNLQASMLSLVSITKAENVRDIFHFRILRSVTFVIYLVHCVVFCLGLSVMFVHITALAEFQSQVSRAKAGYLLSAFGVSGFVGRLLHGVIGNIRIVHLMTQYCVAFALFGLSVLLLTFTTSYSVMVIFACVSGLMYSPYGSLIPPIVAEIVGNDFITAGFGFTNMSCGIGLMAGAPIAGWLYSVTKDYRSSLYFASAAIVISVLIALPICVASFRRHRKLFIDSSKPYLPAEDVNNKLIYM